MASTRKCYSSQTRKNHTGSFLPETVDLLHPPYPHHPLPWSRLHGGDCETEHMNTLLTFNCQPAGVGCVPVALLGSCQWDSGGSRDSTLLSSVNALQSPPGVTSGQHGPGLQPPLERSKTVAVSSLLLQGWCWQGSGEKNTHSHLALALHLNVGLPAKNRRFNRTQRAMIQCPKYPGCSWKSLIVQSTGKIVTWMRKDNQQTLTLRWITY